MKLMGHASRANEFILKVACRRKAKALQSQSPFEVTGVLRFPRASQEWKREDTTGQENSGAGITHRTGNLFVSSLFLHK